MHALTIYRFLTGRLTESHTQFHKIQSMLIDRALILKLAVTAFSQKPKLFSPFCCTQYKQHFSYAATSCDVIVQQIVFLCSRAEHTHIYLLYLLYFNNGVLSILNRYYVKLIHRYNFNNFSTSCSDIQINGLMFSRKIQQNMTQINCSTEI